MNKLISMVNFVLEQRHSHKGDMEDFADLICRYALFLKQTLELWMFIPCDEDGNVLEEPKEHFPTGNNNLEENITLKQKKYQQAKERCLFEVSLEFAEALCSNCRIVEDLVLYNIKLTPTALKQIGL